MRISKEKASQLQTALDWYGCPPDEVELVKEAYRRDPEAAGASFALMAAEIELARRIPLDGKSPA